MSISQSEQANIYGIIIDAQFPKKTHKNDQYRAVLKIIDQSMNISMSGSAGDINNTYVTCNLTSKTLAKLPKVDYIGQVIRIHRGSVWIFKNTKTFSSDLDRGGNWVMFQGAKEDQETLVEPEVPKVMPVKKGVKVGEAESKILGFMEGDHESGSLNSC